MIESLKIYNFRNFEKIELEFDKNITLIYGDNGKGKSSILEALSYLGNIHTKNKLEFTVKQGKDSFFIEGSSSDDVLKFSFDTASKKKLYNINDKKLSAKNFLENSLKFCYFDPTTMNMFLLGPSKRRDYLDTILLNTFPGYNNIQKHYTKVLKSRNATLHAIAEGKAKTSELDYWDQTFCEAATESYRYRYLLVQFFQERSIELTKFLSEKHENITFEYLSKVDFTNPMKTMKEYLQENRDSDLILQKTHIGPHRDDFDIHLNGSSLASYASRGETKSIILGLKLIESKFIEERTSRRPIFLIDDFSSELDNSHRKKLLEALKDYQLVLTNITTLDIEDSHQIQL